MSQERLDGTDISQLREEYTQKVNETLPETAQSSEGWPIHLNHCFGRVVLDNLFQDEWYGYAADRPAYENLTRE